MEKDQILQVLEQLPQQGLEAVKRLFTELNYKYADDILRADGIIDFLKDDPRIIARGGSDGAFEIIFASLVSDKLHILTERAIIKAIAPHHPNALYVFSNQGQTHWHFVNSKTEKSTKRSILRRISVSDEERLRTAAERIEKLYVEEQDSSTEIWKKHAEAFDVEKVSDAFFKAFVDVFERFRDSLASQSTDREWAHDYALQFINRLTFLYFIQRKRWLGNNPEFLSHFWKAYKKQNGIVNTFFSNWLSILFFQVFNGNRVEAFSQFPQEIRQALGTAPYLNGGLFTENEIDTKYSVNISDNAFLGLFSFLEQYNFTICEDSPFDQEVAVDPEMIGRIYESLVNVSDEVDTRGDAGIFYTGRIEIDLVCSLSLTNWLCNRLGVEHRNCLYEFVFAFEDDEKASSDKQITQADLWQPLGLALQQMKAVDPACGSGSFLVGMLMVLDGLEDRVEKHTGTAYTTYDRRKRIIGDNLYGVDVMKWAVEIAELRLWLQLVVDADIPEAERIISPLLPNLSFNVRCGDSLDQQVGGIDLADLRGVLAVYANQALRAKDIREQKQQIDTLKKEKHAFYSGATNRKCKTVLQLETLERQVFTNLLQTLHSFKKHDLSILVERQKDAVQELLFTEPFSEPSKTGVLDQQKALNTEIAELETAIAAITRQGKLPFLWDIAFVEVFSGESRGFDIVIGNPPYVRQELIAPPHKKETTTEERKAYKTRLMESVYHRFPDFFKGKKLDAKNDLYVYFYFHGLKLLNETGSFCFITSNSWLDVGYGKDLQGFLLQHCPIHFIIDNQVKRSFKQAAINTAIVLLGAPTKNKGIFAAHQARFVLFKTPFENVFSPVLWEELHEAGSKHETPEYRLFPITQAELLHEGMEEPEEQPAKKPRPTAYAGNKWGGKYLRAPEIYWKILEKGKGKLVPLGQVAQVRRGVTTGANEFFYLNKQKAKEWGIEEEFLRPVIISPRSFRRPYIELPSVHDVAFVCSKSRAELKGTRALEYILKAESTITDEGIPVSQRSSVKTRKPWYGLKERDWGSLLWPMIHNDRHCVFINSGACVVDHNLFEILHSHTEQLWLSLAWSGSVLFKEMLGRSNLGEGALKTEGIDIKRIPLINPELIDPIQAKKVLGVARYEEFQPFEADIDSDYRQMLDKYIAGLIGLTTSELDELHITTNELIKRRLQKSRNNEA